MSEFNMPIRPQESNKSTFGKVLNISGSDKYIGAAFLSTLAAYKSGAGYVTLSSSKNVINSVSQMLPEAVYISHKEGLKNLNNYTTVLIGCGLGTDWKATDILLKTIVKMQDTETPLVIDADGLNILSRFKTGVRLPQNTIITPHPIEASRLLGKTPEGILSDLNCAARELAQIYRCTVVLKSHRTIICNTKNQYTNEHGNSALAKAGSGDVLAGITAGLLTQKVSAFDAAKLAVYLHSVSGEIASKDLTEYSVMPSDIIKYLHQAIKTLL